VTLDISRFQAGTCRRKRKSDLVKEGYSPSITRWSWRSRGRRDSDTVGSRAEACPGRGGV